ncbi:MAG: ABC transporter substrate-binding protein [Candidatus Limnocylindrales bacterium]
MSRHEPRSRRLALAATVALLVAASCGDPSISPRDGATRQPGQSPGTTAIASNRPSLSPFVPMVYPPDAPAPCDQDAGETPDHGPYRGSIRRITATDPRTVVFELCDADPAFLARIAAPSLAINDTDWLRSRIDPSAGAQRILSEVNGTGPFRLESWDGGSDVALARVDGYGGVRARTGAVVFVAQSDGGQRLAKLREGSVDGIDLVPPGDAATVSENPELILAPREGLNVVYIGFNNRFAPFDSETVRLALAVGIDRAMIVDDAFPAGTTLASHFLPCAIPAGCSGAGWPGHDPALARERLATAGFDDGFPTTITYSDEPRDYLPDPTAVATALQTQLREYLGIEATLKVLPFDELTVAADAGTIDGLYLLGARTRFPDASILLERHFGPGSSGQFGKRFDDIGRTLEQGRSSADPEVRALGYARANDRIRVHVPMIPLAHVGSLAAIRSDVAGYFASATATDRLATVVPGDRTQFVFMQTSRPAGLYCADETDEATLRICAQLSEPLYRHDIPEPGLAPALAEACLPDAELVVWSCTLRAGVRFHDGSVLDANDVVLSYAVQWDADHPLHRGRDGAFTAFIDRFGGLLNPPPAP